MPTMRSRCARRRAGVRLLSKDDLAAAKNLLISSRRERGAAAGRRGLRPARTMASSFRPMVRWASAALAIGNVKYGTQSGLFKQMTGSSSRCALISGTPSRSPARSC